MRDIECSTHSRPLLSPRCSEGAFDLGEILLLGRATIDCAVVRNTVNYRHC